MLNQYLLRYISRFYLFYYFIFFGLVIFLMLFSLRRSRTFMLLFLIFCLFVCLLVYSLKDGNNIRSWDLLFEGGVLGVPQIIANIRGLIFIGYPFEKIKAKLMKKKETFTFMQLIKINELILNYFNETFYELIKVATEDKKVV